MIMIGQIREVYGDDKYPSIKELINRPIKDKEKILEYMRKSKVIAQAPAVGMDLINPNNKTLELSLMTDGDYEWRSDVIYYVDKYDMELPEEFINHIVSEK
ncbi:hypothetical protein [Clostridium sp. YIM B02551]|uniref:hypothetical protein n=1 Tax=Clostridium sp. YIM B02551 TaxID=2910679 RepID=UPI001EEC6B79|nr:hypothetical protein [Clostridium sp. YIM B02551]